MTTSACGGAAATTVNPSPVTSPSDTQSTSTSNASTPPASSGGQTGAVTPTLDNVGLSQIQGKAMVEDPDGYQVRVTFDFTSEGYSVDIANARPGLALLVPPILQGSFGFQSLSYQRNAPIPTFGMLAVYGSASPVCKGIAQGLKGVQSQEGDWKVTHAGVVSNGGCAIEFFSAATVYKSSATQAPYGRTATLAPDDYINGTIQTGEYMAGAIPSAGAEEYLAALNHPLAIAISMGVSYKKSNGSCEPEFSETSSWRAGYLLLLPVSGNPCAALGA
jgi:hypothetical protein